MSAHDNSEHGDGATQLAQALIAQLERIGGASTTTTGGLSAVEARLATHYALLSNALGNFGRHSAVRLALLSPPPTLVSRPGGSGGGSYTKLLLGPPIDGAATVTTYGADGRRLQRLTYLADGVQVQNPGDIRTVEIEDSRGTPFRVGFVSTPATTGTY
ncbi:MAG TPA: hypothetical protein VI357_09090 [Mycobacteriales bacterium]